MPSGDAGPSGGGDDAEPDALAPLSGRKLREQMAATGGKGVAGGSKGSPRSQGGAQARAAAATAGSGHSGDGRSPRSGGSPRAGGAGGAGGAGAGGGVGLQPSKPAGDVRRGRTLASPRASFTNGGKSPRGGADRGSVVNNVHKMQSWYDGRGSASPRGRK